MKVKKIHIKTGDIEVIEIGNYIIFRDVETGHISAINGQKVTTETPFIPTNLFERLESAENKLRELSKTKTGLKLWNQHQSLIDKLEHDVLEWHKTGNISQRTN